MRQCLMILLLLCTVGCDETTTTTKITVRLPNEEPREYKTKSRVHFANGIVWFEAEDGTDVAVLSGIVESKVEEK